MANTSSQPATEKQYKFLASLAERPYIKNIALDLLPRIRTRKQASELISIILDFEQLLKSRFTTKEDCDAIDARIDTLKAELSNA